MSKKELTLGSKILLLGLAVGDLVHPFISRRELYKRVTYGKSNSIDVTLHRMIARGWLKFVDKEGERFIKLTKKGQIEALMAKAQLPAPVDWDGKWRIIFFDNRNSLEKNGIY